MKHTCRLCDAPAVGQYKVPIPMQPPQQMNLCAKHLRLCQDDYQMFCYAMDEAKPPIPSIEPTQFNCCFCEKEYDQRDMVRANGGVGYCSKSCAESDATRGVKR